MKTTHIYELKGKYILYKNRIHKIVDIYTSGSVFVLLTSSTRINILKSDEQNFLEGIMVSKNRESLEDYERECPDDEIQEEPPTSADNTPIDVSSVSNVIPTNVEGSSSLAIEQSNNEPQVSIIASNEGFYQAPVETVIQKHGSELASSLMDALRKTKAGVMKKDQAESVCNIARELTSLAKEEINLIKTLRK